jgi:hypothetical protein
VAYWLVRVATVLVLAIGDFAMLVCLLRVIYSFYPPRIKVQRKIHAECDRCKRKPFWFTICNDCNQKEKKALKEQDEPLGVAMFILFPGIVAVCAMIAWCFPVH